MPSTVAQRERSAAPPLEYPKSWTSAGVSAELMSSPAESEVVASVSRNASRLTLFAIALRPSSPSDTASTKVQKGGSSAEPTRARRSRVHVATSGGSWSELNFVSPQASMRLHYHTAHFPDACTMRAARGPALSGSHGKTHRPVLHRACTSEKLIIHAMTGGFDWN